MTEHLKEHPEEQLLADGYRKYHGSAFDVYSHKDICIHSGKCV